MSLADKAQRNFEENEDMDVRTATIIAVQEYIDGRREEIEEYMQSNASSNFKDFGRLKELEHIEKEVTD